MIVFHAGTARRDDGAVVTNGGRVLGVTALGRDDRGRATKAYDNVSRIHFEGMHYRTDIGAARAVARYPLSWAPSWALSSASSAPASSPA